MNSKMEQNMTSEQHAIPFPLQLFKSIEFGNREIMDWVSQGKAFSIKNTARFVDEVCQPILNFSRLESFLQCLHLHGFRKLILGPDFTAYYHPCFRRRDPDQLCRIKPVNPQQSNFYEKTIASFLSNPSAILNSSSPRSTSPRASNRSNYRNLTRNQPPPVISVNTMNHAYDDCHNDDHSEESFGAENTSTETTRKSLSVMSFISNFHSSKDYNKALSTDLSVTSISSNSSLSTHTSLVDSPKSPDSNASLKSSFNSPLSSDIHNACNSTLSHQSNDSNDSHHEDSINTSNSMKSDSCPSLTLHTTTESTLPVCNISNKRNHHVTFSPSSKDLQLPVETSSKRSKPEYQMNHSRSNNTAIPIDTQAKLYLDVDTSLVESYGDIYYRLNDGTFLCVPADCALTPTTTVNLINGANSSNGCDSFDAITPLRRSELKPTAVDEADSTLSSTNEKEPNSQSQSSNKIWTQSLSDSESESPSSSAKVDIHTDNSAIIKATWVGATSELSTVNDKSIQLVTVNGTESETSSKDVYDHFASIFDFSLGSSSYDLLNSVLMTSNCTGASTSDGQTSNHKNSAWGLSSLSMEQRCY